ncbi:MAG: pilus assembly protein [Rhodobacteraceae bacterium]|nr:pilus assembly protein [Paracoccaceae bacterium]
MKNFGRKHGLAVRFKQLIRNFRDDSGATTVEFVLWVPVFMFILMITVDVSLLFLRQSNLWYVARDGARQASLRLITDDATLRNFVETRGTFGGDRPTAVDATAPASENTHIDTGLQTVTVVLRVPMVDVGIFGILNIGGRAINVGNSGDLVAFVKMRLEPI